MEENIEIGRTLAWNYAITIILDPLARLVRINAAQKGVLAPTFRQRPEKLMDRPLINSVSHPRESMKGTTDDAPQVFDASQDPDAPLGSDLPNDAVELVQSEANRNTPPLIRCSMRHQ